MGVHCTLKEVGLGSDAKLARIAAIGGRYCIGSYWWPPARADFPAMRNIDEVRDVHCFQSLGLWSALRHCEGTGPAQRRLLNSATASNGSCDECHGRTLI